MKSGVRALGIAESFSEDRSTIAGAVVQADRVLDGLAFTSCTVGGTDATDSVVELLSDLDRPDIRYVLIAGIAPAWYNILDLPTIHEAVDRPVLSVSFEGSEGLEPALREAFDGAGLTRRLTTYHAQPDRHEVSVGDETVYVRAVGCSESTATDVVRSFTPEGGRPEPLRVARMAARAGEDYRE